MDVFQGVGGIVGVALFRGQGECTLVQEEAGIEAGMPRGESLSNVQSI